MAETTLLIRLGRTLYWASSGLAVLAILGGAAIAVMFLIFEGANNIWGALGGAGSAILGGIVLAMVAWSIGKAARYILANE